MLKKIIEVIERIKKKGYQAYLIGGSSRDLLLSRDFKDIDIATSAPISCIASLFSIENDDGKAMGSIKISYKNYIMEITRFRKEEYQEKSIFPKVKEFVQSVEEDSLRRDFTINSIYLDLSTRQIIDPCGGLNDLLQYKVKMIGDPFKRIHEDPTRILRGLRIATKLNFRLDEETKQAFHTQIKELNRISNTKYKREIEKFYQELPSQQVKRLFAAYEIEEREEIQ